jgi:hypothetical protein
MDIRKLVVTYGVANIRVFIDNIEYMIDPTHDDPSGHHKICFVRVVDARPTAAPEWTSTIYNQKRMYISDVNRSGDYIRVFALVDEDNKYERIG